MAEKEYPTLEVRPSYGTERETPPEPPKETKEDKVSSTLLQTLEKLNQKADNTAISTNLLADPNIRNYLSARQAGKKVVMIPEDELPTEPQPVVDSPKVDLESMSNADLAKYTAAEVAKTVDKMVNDRIRQLEEKTSQRLEGLDAQSRNTQSKAIESEIEAAKRKFKDFEQMKPVMMEVNSTVQGLSVEELYHLSKLRKGVPPVTQKEIETERPSTPPSARRTFQRPERVQGRNGFSKALDSVLRDKEYGGLNVTSEE